MSYDATVSASTGSLNVSLSRQAITVDNLTINSQATVTVGYNASLSVGTATTLTDGATLSDTSGGNLSLGTFTTTGSGALSISGITSPTLSNTFINGSIVIGEEAYLYLSNSTLSPSGVINIDGQQNGLELSAPLTNGQIVFNGASYEFGNVVPSSGSMGSITFGPNVTVKAGSSSGYFGGNSSDVVINDGTILSQTGHTIECNAVLQNAGTILVSQTSELYLAGTWQNTGTILSNNGTVAISSIPEVSQRGTFQVNNGTLSLQGGVSTTDVDSLSVTNSTISVGTLGVVSNSGILNIQDGSNLWRLAGGKITGGSITANAGTTLEVQSTPSPSTLDSLSLNANVTIDTGGYLQITGNSSVPGASIAMTSSATAAAKLSYATATSFTGGAQVIFNGTADTGQVLDSTIAAGLTICSGTAGGSIGNIENTMTIAGQVVASTPGHTVTINGFNATNNGLLTASAGTLLIDVTENLNGMTTVNTFTNNGALSIGPAGTLSIAGKFSQSSAATDTFILAGTSVGSFGQIAGNANMTLAGNLNITLVGNYQPQTGDVIPIITTSAGAISGTFASLSLPSLSNGESFDVDYTPQTVYLQVVPETSTTFIFAALATSITLRRRAKKRLS